MDDFFDRLGFPFPGTKDETFFPDGRNRTDKRQQERMVRVLKDEDLLKEHGDAGTFIIRVQHRQHSSWQGMVSWVEEDRTVPFRSALELIKMIDEALNDGGNEPDCNSLVKNQEKRVNNGSGGIQE